MVEPANALGDPGNIPPQTTRLSVTELPRPSPRTPPPTPLPQPSTGQPMSPLPSQESISTVNAVLRTAGWALSARVLLLLALIGAFSLAVMAMAVESLFRIYIFVGFCLAVLGPLVFLEARKR